MMPPPPPPPPPPGPGVVVENGHHVPQQETTTLTIVLNVTTTVTHILLGAVAFSAFFFANIFDGSNSLTQHIHLCVFGYVILMSQAILTFNPHNGWANSVKYPNKKIIHWVLQVIGSILAIAGSLIRFTSLSENLQSAHGILGLVATILTAVSLIGGVMNLIFPKQLSTILFRTLHICVGTLTITVAFICLCFGFDNWYRLLLGDINADLSISLTIIALVGVLLPTFFGLTKRFNKR